ncbi:MAG: glutamate-5-semialdehyde dehydrogenase [Dehalococcoidia bacterium]|nr:glutamate-5-semialdehyde dehydrogenase [Dehalococcoidia bacterium]
MDSVTREMEEKGKMARAARKKLAFFPTQSKNEALLNVAEALITREDEVLAANATDYKKASSSGMNEAMLDRLILSPERIQSIARDVRAVAALPDPVGEIFDMRTMPNGLLLGKKRVPLGVVGAIYESRPDVTIAISSLCLKSGNAVILRGGKEAINSCTALARIAMEATQEAGVPQGAIQFVASPGRALVNHMLKMKETINLMIPRGGADLIRLVSENATMPVITGGVGVCHIYIDREANLDSAVAIAYNAKVQRPTVCNAMDCLLVHSQIAGEYLPSIATEWSNAGVEMHCDERAMDILKPFNFANAVRATKEDWGKEFLSLTAAIKVVDSLDEALEHIDKYGSGHSEAIVSEDYSATMRFLNEADAACVYANASTRFTDGAQFGLGAEIGISTQKFHARGPMGLKELTSYKWIIFGSGQVRP